MEKVLVIIVTYNGLKWVDKCLGSINYSSVRPDILVVDNVSTDGTPAYIQKHYPAAHLVQTKKNLGFGKANNIGLKYALQVGYAYVYLLNQDAWLLPDTLAILIENQRKYPAYGILSPIQVQANLKHMDTNFVAGVCSWASNPDFLNDLYFGNRADVYPVSNVMAAHWLISRACLKQVGGFSPVFPHYGEDNNYVDRAFYHGWKVGIVPSCQGVHDREDRKITRSHAMYMLYIGCLCSLSNIHTKSGKGIVRMLYRLFRGCIRHASFYPFVYMGRLVKEYYSIRKKAEASKHEGAFL